MKVHIEARLDQSVGFCPPSGYRYTKCGAVLPAEHVLYKSVFRWKLGSRVTCKICRIKLGYDK